MKYIRNATALAAALFLAAPLTVFGSVSSADIQTLDTTAKASLSSAAGMSNGAWIPTTGSAAVSSDDGYAGEYVLFGIGDENINFQGKKVVVTNVGDTEGSIILNSDGTGAVIDSTAGVEEPLNTWSVTDGEIYMLGDNYEFTGTLEDGIIKIGTDMPYYFALKGMDLSSYTIVEGVDFVKACMAGTYYLTKETMADGSVFLNRTQVSCNILRGFGEPSLKLYEDGTGALDVGDHQDITWNENAMTLNGQEYALTREGRSITIDMKDYTMEFTYIPEGETYLKLNWDEVADSVQAEYPGKFLSLGESGLKYYVPSSYAPRELTEEDLADDMVSNNVEEIDIDDDGYWDNDIYAYYYYLADDTYESVAEWLEEDSGLTWYPVNINGLEFLCWENYNEEVDTHSFWFCTFHENGYETDVIYRTQHTLINDDYRAFVYKMAAGILADA